MKLAHLADLHLGFRQYARQTAHGINQREADVAAAFRRAIDGVIAAEPDIVLIAGDVFHSVRPTNPAILDSFNQIRRLRDALENTPVVIIAGNHDTPRTVETGTILTLFEAVPGVHAVTRDPRTIAFDRLDLSVTCVPHAAMRATPRPTLRPSGDAKWQVLMTHGEIAGVVPGDRSFAEYGGALVEPGELHSDEWSYVALGHYHVAQPVADRAWFAGSLDFVSMNPWGEIREGHRLGWGDAKGWLLVTLRDREPAVTFQPIPRARRHIDLEWIDGTGLGAEALDDLVRTQVAGLSDDVDDQIVRQVITDVPRGVVRDMDHAFIRELKARALHFHLDPRRPLAKEEVGVAAPGQRQTLRDIVDDYLRRRPVTPGVDREELVRLGRHYLDQIERDPADR